MLSIFPSHAQLILFVFFPARDDVNIFHGPQTVFIRVGNWSFGCCDFKTMHVGKRYHSDYSLSSSIYFLPVILGRMGHFLHALLLFTFFPLKLPKLSCCYLVLLDSAGQQWLPRVEESVLKFWRGKFNQQSNHFCWDGKKKKRRLVWMTKHLWTTKKVNWNWKEVDLKKIAWKA